MKSKSLHIRCDDRAETVVFTKYIYKNGDADYEISIEDSYCGGDYMGIAGRFKRAWKAFWAKPIYHTGIYVEGEGRIRKFLEDCLDLVKG